MVIDILTHTPLWVWGLLAGVLALGLAQTRSRELGVGRVTVVPLILAALSLLGAASAFGVTLLALGGWAAGFALAYRYAGPAVRARGATWSAQRQRLHVPGSWVPLCLIIGLFLLKYAVGIALAMQHALAADPVFAGACSVAYGAFAGLFSSRALALRRLSRASAGDASADAGTAAPIA